MTDNTPTPAAGFILSNKLYDKLKFLVQIILPGLAVLYAALSQWWGFPKVQEVVGSIGAIAVFLGLLLGRSSANFQNAVAQEAAPDGTFDVTTLEDGKKSVTLGFEQDPETLVDGRKLVFIVKESTPDPPEEPREENVS